MTTELVKEFYYDHPIQDVWKSLTTTETMKEWYFPQLRGFEPLVGQEFIFQDADAQYRKKWVVTQVEPPNTFAHSWAYEGFPGSSEVVFDLFEEEAGTRLRVTQTGLESFPDHPHFKRDRFEAGWNNLLGINLRRVLDNAVNLPDYI